MKAYIRAISIGMMIWFCIAISFLVLEKIPVVNQSPILLAILAIIAIAVFARIGAFYFYNKGNEINGMLLGFVLSGTAMLLDTLLYIPLVEIPKGKSYYDFFSDPLLWILFLVNIFSVYVYWRQKIKK